MQVAAFGAANMFIITQKHKPAPISSKKIFFAALYCTGYWVGKINDRRFR